jgi:hypothetical protein
MGTEHQTTIEEDEIGENQSRGDKEKMTIREEQKQVEARKDKNKDNKYKVQREGKRTVEWL